MTVLRRFARPLLAAAFIAEGWRAVRHPEATLAAAPQARTALQRGAEQVPYLPANPELIVRGIGAAKIGAGALLGLGIAPRAAAGVLAALQVPTLLVAHPVWVRDQRTAALTGLAGDAALLGGALLAAADTAGKPSLAWRFDNHRTQAEKVRDEVAKATAVTARRKDVVHGIKRTTEGLTRDVSHAVDLGRRDARHAARALRRQASSASGAVAEALPG